MKKKKLFYLYNVFPELKVALHGTFIIHLNTNTQLTITKGTYNHI